MESVLVIIQKQTFARARTISDIHIHEREREPKTDNRATNLKESRWKEYDISFGKRIERICGPAENGRETA
jgi:hypothetical protein